MKKIELHKGYIELLASNLVLLTLKDNVTIEEEDILEIKEINTKLTNGLDYGLITNCGNYTSISTEARKLTAKKEMEGKEANDYQPAQISFRRKTKFAPATSMIQLLIAVVLGLMIMG